MLANNEYSGQYLEILKQGYCGCKGAQGVIRRMCTMAVTSIGRVNSGSNRYLELLTLVRVEFTGITEPNYDEVHRRGGISLVITDLKVRQIIDKSDHDSFGRLAKACKKSQEHGSSYCHVDVLVRDQSCWRGV